MDLYNTRVRQAMSDKYVEVTQAKALMDKQLREITHELSGSDAKRKLSYEKYKRKKDQIDALAATIKVLDIQIDVWTQAREICLNIADELTKEE